MLKTITKEQLQEVYDLQREMFDKNKDWRFGQCFFNALYTLYPEVADRIRATDLDPFHIDTGKRFNKCVAAITEGYDDPTE